MVHNLRVRSAGDTLALRPIGQRLLRTLEGVLETQLASAPYCDQRSDLGPSGASKSALGLRRCPRARWRFLEAAVPKNEAVRTLFVLADTRPGRVGLCLVGGDDGDDRLC